MKQPTENNMTLPILAEITGNIHVGLAALGAAIGVGLIGMGAASAVGRNPGAATPILVQAILASPSPKRIVFYAHLPRPLNITGGRVALCCVHDLS